MIVGNNTRLWSSATVYLVTATLLFIAASAQAARQYSSQRECATCHVMWLEDFKRKDVTTLIPFDPQPVVTTGKQDVASTERMCFSCHDGFVLDSRKNWLNKPHAHPVGVKPSKRIRIPTSKGKTIFPLNEDGKMYCGTCHTAHGVSWNQDEAPVFMRANNIDSRLCLACHINQATGPKEGNHPLFKKPPHSTAELKKAGGKFARDGSVICQSCHQPHGAPAKKMLVMDNGDSNLCQHCHKDKKQVRGSKHDMSLMAPKERNRNGDTAVESGPCGACHVPHNGKGPALWARERALGVPPQAASCLGCHKEGGPAHKKTLGQHSHPVGASISKLGINVINGQWQLKSKSASDAKLQPLPLYDRHGLKSANGSNVGCGSCHDPHKWQSAVTANSEAKPIDPTKLEGDDQSSFLRIPGDSNSSLCTNCHVDKRPVLLSRHNTLPREDKGAGKNSGKKKKPPKDGVHDSAKGVCQACHTPHNANAGNLWARKQTDANTTIASMCGDCHRKGGTAEAKLTGVHSHPLGKPVKNAKGISLPLFDSNGKRVDHGGGVDCASCHNPHQWDPKDAASTVGLSEHVEGDTSNSFLRKPVIENSELCLACHADKRSVHNTEHDLRVTASNSTNTLGQKVKESGPCGQCHVPHNATDAARIWARTLGEGEDKVEQLCRSCHSEVGVASAKQPPSATHPGEVTLWSGDVRERFRKSADVPLPVYDQHGKPGRTGKITCTTCHEPHQWSSGSKKAKGKNTEGTVDNSFLRIRNTENFVCADCHGLDALFRYKYFHGETSRKKHRLYR